MNGETKAPEFLTEQELAKVLAHSDVRTRCMWILAYGHALRASEIAALTLEDVKSGKIVCRRGKKSIQTTESLRQHEQQALADWLKTRGDADGSLMLFTSRQGSGLTRQQVYNLFRKCAELAGIEAGRVNPHILKHSYASHLLRRGVDLAYIQVACGHAHISSTTKYTHVTVRETQVKSDDVVAKVFAAA